MCLRRASAAALKADLCSPRSGRAIALSKSSYFTCFARRSREHMSHSWHLSWMWRKIRLAHTRAPIQANKSRSDWRTFSQFVAQPHASCIINRIPIWIGRKVCNCLWRAQPKTTLTFVALHRCALCIGAAACFLCAVRSCRADVLYIHRF